MEDWNPHEDDDEISRPPDRKGKRIVDPEWSPSESESDSDDASTESDGGEDQQLLPCPAVENDHSSVQPEEEQATLTINNNIFYLFDVEAAPYRSWNPRCFYNFFCRLSPCKENNVFVKSHDGWKLHMKEFHQVSDTKSLPDLLAITDWVNGGKKRPWPRPQPPLPIPQPIQPLPAPAGWTPPEGCRPATKESNIFDQFDAIEVEDAGDKQPTPLKYYCLLVPCFGEGIPGKGMQDLKNHRKAVHNIPALSDNKKEQLPNGWDVRAWVNEKKPRHYVPGPKKAARKTKVRSSDAGNSGEIVSALAMAMATVQPTILESTDMEPKGPRKRATRVESDDSAEPPLMRRKKSLVSSSAGTKDVDPVAVTENVDPDQAGSEKQVDPVAVTEYFGPGDPAAAGIETATENVNPFAAAAGAENVDPNAEAAYVEDAPDNVIHLEDSSDEEDTQNPADLLGEENFLNVAEFSLNHESYELAAFASMESSHHRPDLMESSRDFHTQMESSLHLPEPMESLHHNRDCTDDQPAVNLGMGEREPPIYTDENHESNRVFENIFGRPILEHMVIPSNSSFDISKEQNTTIFGVEQFDKHSIGKHHPSLQEESHDKRILLGHLNHNYLSDVPNMYPKAMVHPQNLPAAMMAIMGAQQQPTVAAIASQHEQALVEATIAAPQQAVVVRAQHQQVHQQILATSTITALQQARAVEAQAEMLEIIGAQQQPPPAIASRHYQGLVRATNAAPQQAVAVAQHQRPLISKGCSLESLIVVSPNLIDTSMVARTSPYSLEGPSAVSSTGLNALEGQVVGAVPLDPNIKPLLSKGCSSESLTVVSPDLIDTSMVGRTSPYLLEGPSAVSSTGLNTLEGQVVGATGTTSFKGRMVSTTSPDTLEDDVVVATTPASSGVQKVASTSPDSSEATAVEHSIKDPQVESSDLGKDVDGNHEKEMNTSHMMAQELSDEQVDSNQAAPNSSVHDALTRFLDGLDHEEDELYSASREFDSDLLDF